MKALALSPALSGAPIFGWCTRLWRWLLRGSSVSGGCRGAYFVDDCSTIDPDTGRERMR